MDVSTMTDAPMLEDADHEAQENADPEGRMFVRDALKTFDAWVNADQDNRDEMLSDLMFQALEQWDELDKQARAAMNRPMFTVDMCSPFVRQVSGELRQKPPSAKVHPGENGDAATAEVLGGLWRDIEQKSHADQVYALAGGQAAACGRGSFRLSYEYEGDDTFLMALRLRSIPNPLAVVWDPGAKLPDKSDARGCFVYEDMERSAYEARWPGASKTEWPSMDSSYGNRPGWFMSDTVRVCEYWKVDHVPAELVMMSDGQVLRDATEQMVMETIEAAARNGRQIQVERRRRVMRRRVQLYLMNGAEILPKPNGEREPYVWPGSRIPIFSVEGEEIHINGRTVRRGLIRPIKDLQRVRNWAATAEVETVALAPQAKWLATKAMIKGVEHVWRNANSAQHQVLTYTPDKDAPEMRPTRVDPPDENRAAGSLADRAVDSAKTALGIYSASLGEQGNETSGKAINARQAQADTGTYLYIDNLTVQLQAACEAGLEVMPYIYDTTRQVRILGPDMAPKVVRINDGRYDLGRGRYDTIVKTGPTFANARQETAENMMEFARISPPQVVPIILTRVAELQDWPGSDTFAQEVRAALNPQATLPGALPGGQPPGMPGAPPGMPQLPGAGPNMPPQNAPGAPQGGIPGMPGMTPPSMMQNAQAGPQSPNAADARAIYDAALRDGVWSVAGENGEEETMGDAPPTASTLPVSSYTPQRFGRGDTLRRLLAYVPA
jgi:hypothetical protein